MFKKLTSEVTDIPELLNQKYLPTLDGLRAIAVVIVLIAHLNYRVYKNEIIETIIPHGNLGVYIFFVLSGFLITTLLLKEKVNTGTISLLNFYKRRFYRIIPVAYLFLIVVIALKYIFNLQVTLKEIALGFLFLRSLDGIFTQFYTAHYWSLSYEEQYYLMYPLILKKSLKLYILIIFIVIFGTFLYHNDYFYRHIHFPGKKLIYQLFINSFDGLAIGSLFAILVFQRIIKNDKPIKYLNFINIVLLLGIFFIHPIKSEFPFKIFSGILIGFLIVFNINPNNKSFLYTFLNTKVLIYIGKLSYSIYIWQQIFTMKIPWEGKFPYSGSVLLNLVMLAVVSYLSYNYYEKFFLNLRYKKEKK